ncbi:MAG: effector-associated domain EAD1-containing protein, partial [Cyanobacteria bacterium P01_D01_bin.73]
MAWTKEDKKQFRLALQDVYRDYSSLEIFVAEELGWGLATIAANSQDLEKVVFSLIRRAEAKGNLESLYNAFRRENPGHHFQRRVSEKTQRRADFPRKPKSTSASSLVSEVKQVHRSSGDNVAGNKYVNNHYPPSASAPNILTRGRFLKYGGAGVVG